MVDLEEIAESNEQAQWILDHHEPVDGERVPRERCRICDEWWPCDLASMAALALLNAGRAEE
jgi:hypothetical protein